MNINTLKTLSKSTTNSNTQSLTFMNKRNGVQYPYLLIEQDDYHNTYIVLNQYPTANLVYYTIEQLISDALPVNEDTPVYIRDEQGILQGITNLELIDNTCFFSTYTPKTLGLSSSESSALVLMNAIQGALFCLIGMLPVLFGIKDAIIKAQDTLHIEIIPGGFLINALVYTIVGILCLLGLSALQTLLMSKTYKDDFNKKQRQSPAGELFQLPATTLALYFVITGISEEVLFRVGILGMLMASSMALGIDTGIAFVLALLASSAIFAIAHAGSYEIPALIIVSLYGAILGIIWMASGTIFTSIVVHMVYDFLAGIIARRDMRKDPHAFFFGKRPNAMVTSKKDENNSENVFEIV